MMKKIVLLTVMLALVVFSNAQRLTSSGPVNTFVEKGPQAKFMLPTPTESKAQWDVEYAFQTPFSGFLGVETDGNMIYSSQWNSEYFYEFNMDGTNPNWFTIPGVTGIRDMAYASTTGYFYGSDASMNIYAMDMVNRQLISTIPVTCTGVTAVRHIAFDPKLDGGSGGFWIGNWTELGAVSMSGTELVPNTATPDLADCSGAAYDAWSDPANPKLWFHMTQYPAAIPQLVEFDINTLSFTGITHETTDMSGYMSGDIAGACASYAAGGKHYILANIQCQTLPNTNIIAAYELEVNSSATVPVSNWAILFSVIAVLAFMFVGTVIKK